MEKLILIYFIGVILSYILMYYQTMFGYLVEKKYMWWSWSYVLLVVIALILILFSDD